MNYQDILDQLKHLSLFDLSRLQLALKYELDNPAKVAQIRAKLHVGMKIEYFAYDLNAVVSGVICELNPKSLITQEDGDPTRWRIPYHVLCVDATPVQDKSNSNHLTKATTSIQMSVGFEHHGVLHFGKVVQRNPKKARVIVVGNKIWHVPYSMLFRVFESAAGNVVAALALPP